MPLSRSSIPDALTGRIGGRLLRLALIGTLVGLGGCASPDQGPTPVPLTFRRYDQWSNAPKRDKTLLVFLPGRGTTGRDFARQGFLGLIGHPHELPPGCFDACTLGPPVDAVTVDLTFPYYAQRTATRRLHDDIIGPARAAGYRRIWLVGCSVGALGAIFYDHEHPGEISGIVAIGPYLGERDVAAEIDAAGGLDRWQPGPGVIAGGDFRRELWLAIRQGRYGQPGHVPLVLGYGTHDRFAAGQRLLARQLPPARVFTTFGFHDWGTWRALWRQILRSPVSPVSAGSEPPVFSENL